MNPEELENQLVNSLKNFRQAYINMSNELKVSIRRDVVAVELKDILTNNPDNYSLRASLESYIQNLYKLSDKEDKTNDTE